VKWSRGEGPGVERSCSIVSRSWVEFVKLAVVLGVAYFLAARLSYFLRAEPGVSVFWPAAGIAVGALIALGPKARLPIATGAFTAIVALNLVSGRNPWLTIAFSLISAGHPLLTAWLIDRWFGCTFKLEDVWRALGFFAATAIGTAIAAVTATAAIMLVEPTVSPLYIWCLWFASASLGVVTVAPLLIGLADAERERLPRQALIEGSVGLVAITVLTASLISLPDGPWATALPEALVFPLLLWIAIRCRPIFAAAAALVVGLTVIGSTTLSIGYFDWGRPLKDRILSAQIFVLTESVLAVLLGAVFAERRRAAAILQDSKASLADALAAGQVIAFDWNALSGETRRSENASLILRDDQVGTEFRGSHFLSRVHPEDRQCFKTLIRELRPGRPSYAMTFRFVRPDGQQVWLEETAKGEFTSTGRLLRIKGLTRDITEQKRAEQALAERNTQLELASKAARVGSFAVDLPTGLVNLSPGCAIILGLPDSNVEISRENARKLVHPEDLAQLDATREQAFLKKQREFVAHYRIIRVDDGEVSWIEARSLIFYDQGGQPLRYIAVIIDTTERKLAEQALAERNAQLELAGRAALVGSYAYDVHKGTMQVSKGYAAIHGLREGTTETTISEWRARVHPEDLARAEGLREHAFAERRNEDNAEYRIVLSSGDVRWIERRGFIFYGKTGRPERVIGVNIDVTERRRTQQVLTDRNRQLELAAKHALVGSFATEMDVARGDLKSQRAQVSPGFAAIYGLPEETAEISVGDWRSLVHADDLPQYLEHRQKVFAERRGEHHAEFRIVRPCGTIRWIEARSFIEYDQAGHARRLVGVNIDITERKRAEEARKILNAELDHRVKNTLATVTAVISHTREGSRSVAEFAAAIERRIRSMAATHQLLSSRHWQELPLKELIRSVLAPYAAGKNTEISGPTVLLKPEAGQALAMVLHELATNAAKYGALSTNTGRVLIRWDQRLNGRPLSILVLEWQEVGGPRVDAPDKSGYGTSTIRDLIPYEFGGTVDLVFAPEGVRCRLELPANWLTHSNGGLASNVSHPSATAGNL